MGSLLKRQLSQPFISTDSVCVSWTSLSPGICIFSKILADSVAGIQGPLFDKHDLVETILHSKIGNSSHHIQNCVIYIYCYHCTESLYLCVIVLMCSSYEAKCTSLKFTYMYIKFCVCACLATTQIKTQNISINPESFCMTRRCNMHLIGNH